MEVCLLLSRSLDDRLGLHQIPLLRNGSNFENLTQVCILGALVQKSLTSSIV